ncbi:MAG: endonuclease/exonuclease/phosphatase family protein [Deltaproteobacteria bacterium]|nr:endonuclease/exonuclease/phosphatase family protein [Deltaproteobacteria bacterium]
MRRVLALLMIACAAACASASSTSSTEDEVGSRPDRAWTPAATKQGNLRIATWNVRNFPKDVMGATSTDAGADAGQAPERDTRPMPLVRKQEETDESVLLDLLDRLDFDVLAVQEINDTARFDAVLARLGEKNGRSYQSTYSLAWDHPQHVGIVVRKDRARIEDPSVHPEVATRPTMRAALSARIVSTKGGGADFGLMVVHLASGDTGGRATLRATQAAEAAKIVAARQSAWADKDFVVVGDMNTARDDQELPGFEAALASSATSLDRAKPESSCSTYFTKSPSNPLLEPSYIDHVFLASMAERDTTIPVTAGAHCYERACKPFESDSKDHGTSYWSVSDHCPVYFEIADEDRD